MQDHSQRFITYTDAMGKTVFRSETAEGLRATRAEVGGNYDVIVGFVLGTDEAGNLIVTTEQPTIEMVVNEPTPLLQEEEEQQNEQAADNFRDVEEVPPEEDDE